MSDYYDRDGNPITAEQWSLKDNAVKKTQVGDYDVSTIYLGLNHSLPGERLTIFETIVFDEGPSKTCECCGQTIYRDNPEFRYSTEAEAIAHHDAIVEALEAGREIPEPVLDESERTDG